MSCANMCQLFLTGAGMIQLTLTLVPVPILVICFPGAPGISLNSADIQGNSRCLGLGRQTCGGTLDIEGWKLRWDPKHDFQENIAYCSLWFHNMFLVFSR